MAKMNFEPPSDYYDERVAGIDEKICELVKELKERAEGNPGFPMQIRINEWAQKYDFNAMFLNSIFSTLYFEEMHGSDIEPENFIKNVSVMRTKEANDGFYSILWMRQFENASVVYLNVSMTEEGRMKFHTLSITGTDEEFNCRSEGGGGSDGNLTYTYVVTPALSEDISRYQFIINESEVPLKKDGSTEIVI